MNDATPLRRGVLQNHSVLEASIRRGWLGRYLGDSSTHYMLECTGESENWEW